MSPGDPAEKQEESAEVIALRKKARGDSLSPAEEELLARATRKPDRQGVPHAHIESLLAERKRSKGA